MTRANDIRNAFHTFKLEVARSSENSRTGKPIPERIIQERMSQELKKEQEVERVRLKNITLRNQMKKLEAHLKVKTFLMNNLYDMWHRRCSHILRRGCIKSYKKQAQP
jgi:hypothetical protein